MKNDADFEKIDRKKRQFMVETGRFAVVLDQQGFIGPVQYEEVQAADGVQHWHAAGVCQDGPQRCEILCIYEIRL